MSSSDNYMFDDSKGFSDDETSSDGYGGVHPRLYDGMVTYIREGIYPEFVILSENRNAYAHWKNRCKRFRLTDTGILLYTANNPSTARAVVRLGEVRLAIRFIHEKIGHTGAKHTNVICARRLYWRSMRRDIYRYVAECEFCKRKKEIKQNDLPLNQIGCPPSHCSSPEEVEEMQELVDRLLLNNDDDLEGELPYYKEETNEPVYEEMDGGQYYMMERDETDTMCGSTYLAALREGRLGKNPHSSLYDDDEEEENDEVKEQTTSLIVSDDVIPPIANEIVMQKVSPCVGLDRSVPSPSEEEGLRIEEREEEQVRIMMERRDERGRRADERVRKRRLVSGSMFDPSIPMEQRIKPNNMTKKSLLEENKALRARLSLLETIQSEERTNMAMQMPPCDNETALMQKNLLHMQREVLMMQRTYWQAKLNNEGFHVQMGDYYDEPAAGEVMVEEHPCAKYEVNEDGIEGGMQLQLHYENEGVEENEGLEDHEIIDEHSLIGNVH